MARSPEAEPASGERVTGATVPAEEVQVEASDPGFRVALSNFEGPFDLLLSLIAKHELDITEVSLSAVTDEFISYLRGLDSEEELDRASEFLVVAATLLLGAMVWLSPPAAAQIENVDRLAISAPTWNGWENLEQSTCTQAQQAAGTCFASNSAPDCVTVGANRLDCFTRVYGGVVARRQWDGQTWQPWSLLSNMAMHSYYASAPECVAWDAGRLFFAQDDRILRFPLPEGQLLPDEPAQTVVSGLPHDGDHENKTVVVAPPAMDL